MTPYETLERELRLEGYAYNSIKNYSSCLKTVLSKCGENPSLEQVKSFLLTIENRSYHKQFTAVVHHYFNLVLKKPISLKDLPYPKKKHYLPDVLSQEEVSQMISACDNLKHKAILCTLYACGLRVSEMIDLKISHIDNKRMLIKIVQAKGNRDRYVPLPKELLDLLRAYYCEFKPKEYLFNGQGSLQYSVRSIGEFLKNLAIKAKIKKHVHPHLFRHSYATHLVEQGVDIALIQKTLGHSTIRTTMTYTKVSKAVLSKIPSPFSTLNKIKHYPVDSCR